MFLFLGIFLEKEMKLKQAQKKALRFSIEVIALFTIGLIFVVNFINVKGLEYLIGYAVSVLMFIRMMVIYK